MLSPLVISGIVLVVIGTISTIIGLTLLIFSQDDNKTWYMWLLFIGGLTLAILGAILMAVSFAHEKQNSINIY